MHALEALAFIINVDDFLTLDAQSLAIHIEVKIFIKSLSKYLCPLDATPENSIKLNLDKAKLF